MRERPILFSAPMVRAILAGTKTQTRRVVKPQPDLTPEWNGEANVAEFYVGDKCVHTRACPYGQPGDRLWVREAFAWFIDYDTINGQSVELGRDPVYRADNPAKVSTRWYPSIHMPRWASRITLEITGVRVERLNDISEADAVAEGVVIPVTIGMTDINANVAAYRDLWETINGPGSWAANPWVFVIEFRRIER